LLNNGSEVNYEVWNAGVPGYDMLEIVVYLKKLMVYDPDLVVYGLYQNDLPGNPSFTFNKEDFYDKSPIIKFFDSTNLHKLKVYQFVRKNIYFYKKNQVHKQFEHKSQLIMQEVSEHPLADIKNITSNNLIVLNIPNLIKEIPYDAPIILELKYVPDLKVIPILEEYESLGPNWDNVLKLVDRDLVHPTKEGHALIAKRLYKEILNTNLYI